MKRGSRPDTSARLKRRQVVQTSSVKMTLNTVILDAELLREIETCVALYVDQGQELVHLLQQPS